MRKRIGQFTILFVLLTTVFAKAEYVRAPYTGVRPAGMGNAFLAISDDNNVLWYNPAGLARIRGIHFNMIDFTAGTESMDTLSRIGKAFTGDTQDLVRPDLEDFNIKIRPTFLTKYFGLSVFENAQGYFDVKEVANYNPLTSTDDPKLDVFSVNDIGVALGAGFPIGPNFSMGATVRAFERTGVDTSLSASQLFAAYAPTQQNPTIPSLTSVLYDTVKKLFGTGVGLGVDLGAILEVPLPKDYPIWKFAAVVDDVGNTTFRGGSTLAPVHATYHFGTSLKYPVSKDAEVNIAIDIRNNFQALPFVKQLFAGAEYRHRLFGLRGGFSQGYPTAGVSLEFPPHTRIHLATYGIELGNHVADRGMRVFMAQFVLGFNPL